MTLMQLVRRVRIDMLRRWIARGKAMRLPLDTGVYFGKIWKGSVKDALRHMERRAEARWGKAGAERLLAEAFHALSYFEEVEDGQAS